MITIEHYDKAKHGYVDDADFVVSFNDNDDKALAEWVAERISYGNGEYREYNNQLITVHA